jgi:epoxyqueuosine reductase
VTLHNGAYTLTDEDDREGTLLRSIDNLKTVIRRAAEEAGFDLAGVAPATDAAELSHFPEWIAAGHAGEMKYLEARDDHGDFKRGALARVAPWARSVVVCAINYNTANPYSTEVNDRDRGWISRYAWSREDYHDAVFRRVKQVEAALQQAVPAELQPSITTRSYVDTGPIVERVYAKYAGVGWIGKNTCVINQKKGSWLFLGVILTSLELTPDIPAPDRCGTCTRCIEACPTDAILAPYQLDSNKCIAYLTIEKRGSIPEDLRAGMGRHVFGCDICQDVCPWNRTAPVTAEAAFAPRSFAPPLYDLAALTEDQFRSEFQDSPVYRARYAGFLRNVAVAMGNSRLEKFRLPLEHLARSPHQLVAEHTCWALAQLD